MIVQVTQRYRSCYWKNTKCSEFKQCLCLTWTLQTLEGFSNTKDNSLNGSREGELKLPKKERELDWHLSCPRQKPMLEDTEADLQGSE